jgi:hypothetical protein
MDLTLLANRQLGLFADHDEIYWNPTRLDPDRPCIRDGHASTATFLLTASPDRYIPSPAHSRTAGAARSVSGAVSYQPVRYSRFRKSFAAATFVTRMFSPS